MRTLWLLALPFLAGCESFLTAVRDAPAQPGVLPLVNAVTGGVGGPVLEGLAALAGLFVGGKVVQVAAPKVVTAAKAVGRRLRKKPAGAAAEAVKA